MLQTTWKRSGVDGIMIHQVTKFINFSVSERVIILKLQSCLSHMFLWSIELNIWLCVYFPFLVISLNWMGFLTLKIIKFFQTFFSYIFAMICRGLNVYFATFFSRKTITALDPNSLKIPSPNYLRAVPIWEN